MDFFLSYFTVKCVIEKIIYTDMNFGSLPTIPRSQNDLNRPCKSTESFPTCLGLFCQLNHTLCACLKLDQ